MKTRDVTFSSISGTENYTVNVGREAVGTIRMVADGRDTNVVPMVAFDGPPKALTIEEVLHVAELMTRL